MNALLVALLALSIPAADPCADVFDRTEACDAVDAEALPAPVDAVAPLAAEPGDVGLGLAWGFLGGAGAAAALAGVGVGVSFFYDTQLAALREAGLATDAAVDDVLFQRTIAQVSAGALVMLAGLFAGTSVAFFLFDPALGRPRFVIEE